MIGPSLFRALRQWWCGRTGHGATSRSGYTELADLSLPFGWMIETEPDGRRYAFSPWHCERCDYIEARP